MSKTKLTFEFKNHTFNDKEGQSLFEDITSEVPFSEDPSFKMEATYLVADDDLAPPCDKIIISGETDENLLVKDTTEKIELLLKNKLNTQEITSYGTIGDINFEIT